MNTEYEASTRIVSSILIVSVLWSLSCCSIWSFKSASFLCNMFVCAKVSLLIDSISCVCCSVSISRSSFLLASPLISENHDISCACVSALCLSSPSIFPILPYVFSAILVTRNCVESLEYPVVSWFDYPNLWMCHLKCPID